MKTHGSAAITRFTKTGGRLALARRPRFAGLCIKGAKPLPLPHTWAKVIPHKSVVTGKDVREVPQYTGENYPMWGLKRVYREAVCFMRSKCSLWTERLGTNSYSATSEFKVLDESLYFIPLSLGFFICNLRFQIILVQ